ncbi:hypothetical protein PV326_005631 [Microctonus aethiopoides]|nr:hypothetical protein PV326_005631 [Microctonus aethiopoides]
MSQPEIKVSFRCDDRIAGDEVGRIQRVYIHKNGHESNYNDGVDDENKEDKNIPLAFYYHLPTAFPGVLIFHRRTRGRIYISKPAYIQLVPLPGALGLYFTLILAPM